MVDLIYCYVTCIVSVYDSKNRLVLLLVNREFLLHFKCLWVEQQSLLVAVVHEIGGRPFLVQLIDGLLLLINVLRCCHFRDYLTYNYSYISIY